MRIAFLHTADVHVDTFNQIFADLEPDAQLFHTVDTGLLERARNEGVETVSDKVLRSLGDLTDADAVLCTCSTLGPIVDEAAKSAPNVIRIDRPLMEQACAVSTRILVALCLESTRKATLDLLQECAAQAGQLITPVVLVCSEAWARFEAGDQSGYATAIADAVKSKLSEHRDIESIILAQASMRVAEQKLRQVSIPVYSSPILAAQKCVEVARRRLPEPVQP